MKNNNKGFSLVEFIVVIAIASILGAVSLGAMNTAYNARSKKATEILYNAIAECKSRNLTGQECYLFVEKDTTAKVYRYSIKRVSDDTVIDSGIIGNTNLKITVSDNDIKNFKLLFDKKTGALYRIKDDATKDLSYYTASSKENITASVTIKVSGVGKTRSFKIDYHTGYLRDITVA